MSADATADAVTTADSSDGATADRAARRSRRARAIAAPSHVVPGVTVWYGGDPWVVVHLLDLQTLLARRLRDRVTERLPVAQCALVPPADAGALVGDAGAPAARAGGRPDLLTVPDADWAVASTRYAALAPLLAPGAARTKAAVQQAADALHVGIATAYRWLRAYETERQLSVLLPHHPLGGKGESRIAPEADAVIAGVVDAFYLQDERPSIADTVLEVQLRCRRAKVDPIPSASTVARRIRVLSEEDVLKRRHGPRAARAAFAPSLGHFPDAGYPLDVVQIDHTKLDVVLVDAHHRRPIGRPWVTLAIDVATRCIVGYSLAMDAPSAASVGRALAHAILQKATWLTRHGLTEVVWPCHGLMRTVHADNAREFRGKHLQRAAQEYGITIEWRPVKRPEFGGHIERLMGTTAAEVQRLPGTMMSDPKTRGDYRPNDEAALTFGEFERWFALWVTHVYHQRVHSGIGTTPLGAWRDALLGTADRPGIGLPTPVADEERLRLDFLPGEERSIQRYGVRMDGIHYWHDVFRHHIGSRADGARVGPDGVRRGGRPKQYTFRTDPLDLSARYVVLSPADGYLRVPYANTNHPPINVWDLRAAKAFLRARGRAAQDEATLFAGYEEMRRLEDTSRAQTTKTRREAERRAQTARAHDRARGEDVGAPGPTAVPARHVDVPAHAASAADGSAGRTFGTPDAVATDAAPETPSLPDILPFDDLEAASDALTGRH